MSRSNEAARPVPHGNEFEGTELKNRLPRTPLGPSEVLIAGIPFSGMSSRSQKSCKARDERQYPDLGTLHGLAFECGSWWPDIRVWLCVACHPNAGLCGLSFERLTLPPSRRTLSEVESSASFSSTSKRG